MSEQARHPNSARFHALLERCGELHDKKQADYGRGNDPFANVRAAEQFGIPAWVGCVMRANDKVSRLQTATRALLTTGMPTLTNEGIEDSLLDLAVYALIALVLYEDVADPVATDEEIAAVTLRARCERPPYHDGPCSGFPRATCPVPAPLNPTKKERRG